MGRASAVLGLLLLVAACGDDGASDAGSTEPPPGLVATTPSSLPTADPGEGLLVIDGLEYDFDVSACSFGSTDGAAVGVPVSLFALEGDGIGPGDEAFTVRVERVFVDGAVPTFSDTIVFHQPGLDFLVQADRSEADGVIIDLRDPTATQPLLKLGDQHVSGSGTFGGRGGTAEDRTLPGTLSAGCPS